jgi:hypothetical protein
MPVGGSPNIPQLCHGEAEVGHWWFAVMAAIALLTQPWAMAMAHPVLHLEQRSPLLGKNCFSGETISSRQFPACYIMVSDNLERGSADDLTWCFLVFSPDWISEGSYIDACLQSSAD